MNILEKQKKVQIDDGKKREEKLQINEEQTLNGQFVLLDFSSVYLGMNSTILELLLIKVSTQILRL